jgi:serine/threonine-protein kinase
MLIREAGKDRRSPDGGGRTRSLPPDLIEASIRRVGVIAPVYAFIYFMAAVLPAMLDPEGRTRFFGEPSYWMPPLVSILLALAVTAALRAALTPSVKLQIGTLFQILGSYGIAFAEYHDIVSGITYRHVGAGGVGLSWVTVWVMLFTIAIPRRPATSIVAAILSVSAVPVVFGFNTALGSNTMALTPFEFFFGLVFPNLLVVLMALVGARVVYHMGRAVREAQEMGSYRLVEQLGQGGMGEVWRAEHRTLARPAAIKLIRPEVLGAAGGEAVDVLQQRFEREAHATALLRSPHTIEVFDFGVTDDGTFYYVMELLDGFDLDRLVEKFGPVPAERAMHFLRDMVDSLAEAHEAELVHRDVKPANVYTCRQGRDVDFVKVLDFGLVKPSGPYTEDAAKLTADHVAGGTPAFMAPEQAIGEERVDARADIYAVGCVGYWLVTGCNVFEGRTPMDTLLKHVHDEPVPPSRRTELEVPAELEALILRCLAKKPSDRPQTGDELLDALAAVPMAEAWTRDRARQWWDEHHVSTVPKASVSYDRSQPGYGSLAATGSQG